MSHGGRRRYIVSYDIADDKRRTAAYKAMLGFGDRIQYSVFYCELNEREVVDLRATLTRIVHAQDDQVLIVDLGRVDGNRSTPIAAVGRPLAVRPRVHLV